MNKEKKGNKGKWEKEKTKNEGKRERKQNGNIHKTKEKRITEKTHEKNIKNGINLLFFTLLNFKLISETERKGRKKRPEKTNHQTFSFCQQKLSILDLNYEFRFLFYFMQFTHQNSKYDLL